jgi:hypothetical protein
MGRFTFGFNVSNRSKQNHDNKTHTSARLAETDRIYVCHSQWYVHQIGSGYVIISGMQNQQDLYMFPF